MKSFLFTLLLVASSIGAASAQDPTKAVHVEALTKLVGAENLDNRILFLGDEVPVTEIAEKKAKGFWNTVRTKTDILIVFSEEMKKVAATRFKGKIFLADDYKTYFSRSWRGQKALNWIIVEGGKVKQLKCTPDFDGFAALMRE
ncbi:MAG: hypothetical protein K9G46_14235 [Flavobacteriales bacterium]|nr:hypothetical protein [Flavobacteriales bacterium]